MFDILFIILRIKRKYDEVQTNTNKSFRDAAENAAMEMVVTLVQLVDFLPIALVSVSSTQLHLH